MNKLFNAVNINALRCVECLLLKKQKYNANMLDIIGNTPIFYAIRNNNIDMVKLLIKYNADINHRKNKGPTPLMIASQYGCLGIVKLLLNRGVNVNTKTKSFRYTALLEAIGSESKDSESIMKLLVDHGANINQKDSSLGLPIYYACMKYNIKKVKILLDCPNININLIKNNPLETCLDLESIDIAKLLIEYGARLSNDYYFKYVHGKKYQKEIDESLEIQSKLQQKCIIFIRRNIKLFPKNELRELHRDLRVHFITN